MNTPQQTAGKAWRKKSNPVILGTLCFVLCMLWVWTSFMTWLDPSGRPCGVGVTSSLKFPAGCRLTSCTYADPERNYEGSFHCDSFKNGKEICKQAAMLNAGEEKVQDMGAGWEVWADDYYDLSFEPEANGSFRIVFSSY